MQKTILPPEVLSGVAVMDALHQDFFNALADLSSTPDAEFGIRYGLFVKQAEQAFLTEEQWMEKINYPLIKAHREQHARALAALHHVHACVMTGDLVTGREVAENLLPQWCVFHMSTMDFECALAMRTAGAESAQAGSVPPSFCVIESATP
jgi:hemerythrin